METKQESMNEISRKNTLAKTIIDLVSDANQSVMGMPAKEQKVILAHVVIDDRIYEVDLTARLVKMEDVVDNNRVIIPITEV